MDREIGGYFGLETFSGSEYYPDLVGVNSARHGLLYILKTKRVKKLYIPQFLCDCISRLCIREGYAFQEYPIGEDFLPLFDGTLEQDEYLYVVNFYGQLSDDQILRLKQRWQNLIVDNVQAFFQKPISGVDTVYSCRKFFGVPDGGYVYAPSAPEIQLQQDSSKDRMRHVLGRFEETGSAYYSVFQHSDEQFYDAPLLAMSPLTRNLLRAVNYDEVRQTRNRNYRFLEAALGKYNSLKLHKPDGPYAYPFYCQNGMAVKKALAAEKIYIPTLWPNVLELAGTLEQDYAQNILPLPCDQRYNEADMQRMIDLLLEIIKGENTDG